MKPDTDVLIIGGGLAGLCSAIHLRKYNAGVVLIEKASYPRHKVCGEYISNEVLPYLQWLGLNIAVLQPVHINIFEFSNVSGKAITSKLTTGGFGISRYALDDYLYREAVKRGVKVLQETVTDIRFKDDIFTIMAGEMTVSSKIVLGAYGKRSNIDQALNREFINSKSPWLAVKAHYKGNFDNDKVAIHNFNGGYCGVSKVEGGRINICYLADYKTFKAYKNIEDYQKNVLCKNKHLKAIFENSEIVFDKPIAISQIYFDKKEPVYNHILMTGDTAGLIHPLCGNGMAMAIHSAKLAAGQVIKYLSGNINREELEAGYKTQWQKQFKNRLLMGRIMASVLENKKTTAMLLKMLHIFPGLLPAIIRHTHGRPITITE